MLPSEFWECTLLDIGYYLVANFNRFKIEQEQAEIMAYKQGQIIASMNATNLSNMFGKKHGGKQYPKFEDYFPNKKKENEECGIYETINDDNKYEFLHKQKMAYEKMGYKF